MLRRDGELVLQLEDDVAVLPAPLVDRRVWRPALWGELRTTMRSKRQAASAKRARAREGEQSIDSLARRLHRHQPPAANERPGASSIAAGLDGACVRRVQLLPRRQVALARRLSIAEVLDQRSHGAPASALEAASHQAHGKCITARSALRPKEQPRRSHCNNTMAIGLRDWRLSVAAAASPHLLPWSCFLVRVLCASCSRAWRPIPTS